MIKNPNLLRFFTAALHNTIHVAFATSVFSEKDFYNRIKLRASPGPFAQPSELPWQTYGQGLRRAKRALHGGSQISPRDFILVSPFSPRGTTEDGTSYGYILAYAHPRVYMNMYIAVHGCARSDSWGDFTFINLGHRNTSRYIPHAHTYTHAKNTLTHTYTHIYCHLRQNPVGIFILLNQSHI